MSKRPINRSRVAFKLVLLIAVIFFWYHLYKSMVTPGN